MADDLSKRGPPDGIRINVNEAWELRDWSKHFNVTPAKLKEAVAAVGVMTKDVKRHLGK
ncbi:DUF3606 domain-containing protein [Stenotrophomonas maltophilia]|jgi:hypothetical protein|uniref:DUF3606 domain-containing protein n=2 Tax=Stenotrophomonas TaxID=40323 RepID=A0AAI9CA27_STEMA|nr:MULTISPECIES: DUF3606 domain-containing protein [Stenotrophomonas]EKT4440953.1 DUF3606 domain-containing protein [Stenotrophomonas maltophilia]MBA0394527.1 DUF3606 domain-containing protein [Stenotrophomonas maltophilia]MBA0454536.1 DUF3606 domain-containing protein [Stenotrophomonas maltophilia]MBH1460526.1 DUF3606 domain-containing protein [Stenotrophomonas maltophilia]MDH0189123.1 DUF3606 domain-containing protein [Stenotrophomonas sp. GD04051]